MKLEGSKPRDYGGQADPPIPDHGFGVLTVASERILPGILIMMVFPGIGGVVARYYYFGKVVAAQKAQSQNILTFTRRNGLCSN